MQLAQDLFGNLIWPLRAAGSEDGDGDGHNDGGGDAGDSDGDSFLGARPHESPGPGGLEAGASPEGEGLAREGPHTRSKQRVSGSDANRIS